MQDSKPTLVIGTREWSSWSLRAWLAMKVANIQFDEVVVRLRRESTSPEISTHSAAGQVPVLKSGDQIVWESLAILEFLAETFPAAGLWPDDAVVRARARSVASEMHAGFGPLREALPMEFNARYPAPEISTDVQKNIDRIQAIWRDCLNDGDRRGDFLFGGFTNADAMFAPVVSRFVTYGIPLDAASSSYCGTIMSLPAMDEWGALSRTEGVPRTD